MNIDKCQQCHLLLYVLLLQMRIAGLEEMFSTVAADKTRKKNILMLPISNKPATLTCRETVSKAMVLSEKITWLTFFIHIYFNHSLMNQVETGEKIRECIYMQQQDKAYYRYVLQVRFSIARRMEKHTLTSVSLVKLPRTHMIFCMAVASVS